MTIANRKHDVVAIQVYDRRVEELPAVGLMKIKMRKQGMNSGLILLHVLYAALTMIGG